MNDEILAVGQVEFINGATPHDVRYHLVVHALDGSDLSEEIAINGRVYTRVNAETRWTTRPYNPPEDFYLQGDPVAAFAPREHATLIRVGDIRLGGIPTTQYQYHVAPDALPGDLRAVKLDLFLGQADGYLVQEQLAYRAIRDESGQEKEFGLVLRLRDAGAQVIIGAPPAQLVDSQLMRAGGGALRGSMRPSPSPQLFPELSDREREILTLIAQGYKNAEIADRLILRPKTVRNHITNILSKLQVADRTEAIIRAREAGLG